MEENENELIVNDDVSITSENEEKENIEDVQVGASENDEQIQETTQEVESPTQEDIEKQIEEKANKLFEEKVEERLKRDRINREREQSKEISKLKQLQNVIMTGLGVENLDEAISKSSEFYKNQGINIPEYKQNLSYSERDEQILAYADAKEIIECGMQEMEKEANRIASIPSNKRTTRENTIFNELCKELVNRKDIEKLKSKGYDTEMLKDKNFIDFRQQFTINTPVEKIVDIYKQVNNFKVEKPKSPGSAKSTTTVKQIKDYYSPEDFDKLTDEELNNPKIMEVVDKSRLQWYKNMKN